MNQYHLEADLMHCQHHNPIASINNMPGEGVIMRPDEMRAFAAALFRLAEQCEERKYNPKQLRVKRVIVPI